MKAFHTLVLVCLVMCVVIERIVLISPNAPTMYQLIYYLSLMENNKTTSNREDEQVRPVCGPLCGHCLLCCCARAACIVPPWLLVQSC